MQYITMKLLNFIWIILIIFINVNCNEEKQHKIFLNNEDLSVYEYGFLGKKGTVDIEISYNKVISEKINQDCYNFKSLFFTGFIYKVEKKIYFINKLKTSNIVLFDFNGKIGQKNHLCFSYEKDCYEFSLDSIYKDTKYDGNVFLYSVSRIEVGDNTLQFSSPNGIESIYVNENNGIVKYTEKSGLGLITYNLRN